MTLVTSAPLWWRLPSAARVYLLRLGSPFRQNVSRCVHSFTRTASAGAVCVGRVGKMASFEMLRCLIACTGRPTLTSIHLLKNGIGDSGVMALATALEDNTHVVELNLRYNNIGDQGAIAIAELVKKNRALQHIYLCTSCLWLTVGGLLVGWVFV